MKSYKQINNLIKLPNKPIPKIMVCSKPYKGLLLYILEVIKLNPEHHHQANWRCDTSFCFAGFVDLIAAYSHNEQEFKMDNYYSPAEDEALLQDKKILRAIRLKEQNLVKESYKGYSKEKYIQKLSVQDIKNVRTVSQYLLGLNDDQAEFLFVQSRCLTELEVTINRILTNTI